MNDEPGSRHELRRKYWAYALEKIREVHKDSGCFINVNLSRETGLMDSLVSVVLKSAVWQIMILRV